MMIIAASNDLAIANNSCAVCLAHLRLLRSINQPRHNRIDPHRFLLYLEGKSKIAFVEKVIPADMQSHDASIHTLL